MITSDALNPSVPQGDTLRLTVTTAPTTHALARLLLLVRGRGANVLDLHWRDGVATFLLDLEKSRQPHLEAAIARIVDVTSIAVCAQD